MALFEDLAGAELLGVNVVTGLAVGVAALFVAPLAAPIVRPIAKAAIKGGIYAYRSALELYEQASSGMGELAAEAQQELHATRNSPATTTAG
jgi:hypothetical protein